MITNFNIWLRSISVIISLGFTTACSAPIGEQQRLPIDTPSPAFKEAVTGDEMESVPSTATTTVTISAPATTTHEPTSTLTPALDWEVIAAEMSEIPESEIWTEPSPNGKWTAAGRMKTDTGIIQGEQELYYTQLKVVSADQSIEWILVEEISPFGLGYTTPEPLHWTADGRYLYFTNRPHVDGCGLFVTGSDLWRANLADGSVTQVLPEGAQSYAFSPDGTLVAYLSWSTPPELALHNLGTGEERRVVLGFEDAGAMVWSPDGAMLALTGAKQPCQAGWTHAIMVIEPSDLTPQTLLPLDERLFITREWPETGKILLEDIDRDLFWLDVDSGEVTQIQ
jgi:hypothetical protein